MDAITSNIPSPPSHVCVMAEWPIKENPDILSFPLPPFPHLSFPPYFLWGKKCHGSRKKYRGSDGFRAGEYFHCSNIRYETSDESILGTVFLPQKS